MTLMVMQSKVRDYTAWRPAYDAHESAELDPVLRTDVSMANPKTRTTSSFCSMLRT